MCSLASGYPVCVYRGWIPLQRIPEAICISEIEVNFTFIYSHTDNQYIEKAISILNVRSWLSYQHFEWIAQINFKREIKIKEQSHLHVTNHVTWLFLDFWSRIFSWHLRKAGHGQLLRLFWRLISIFKVLPDTAEPTRLCRLSVCDVWH